MTSAKYAVNGVTLLWLFQSFASPSLTHIRAQGRNNSQQRGTWSIRPLITSTTLFIHTVWSAALCVVGRFHTCKSKPSSKLRFVGLFGFFLHWLYSVWLFLVSHCNHANGLMVFKRQIYVILSSSAWVACLYTWHWFVGGQTPDVCQKLLVRFSFSVSGGIFLPSRRILSLSSSQKTSERFYFSPNSLM